MGAHILFLYPLPALVPSTVPIPIDAHILSLYPLPALVPSSLPIPLDAHFFLALDLLYLPFHS
jgi:hypothetical protein